MTASSKDQRRLKELECGHAVDVGAFTSNNSHDIFWCRRCDKDVMLAGVKHEYRWKCADCSFGRKYGEAKLEAELGAVKHRNQRGGKGRGHVVTVFYGPKVIHTFGNKDQLALIPDNERPPF